MRTKPNKFIAIVFLLPVLFVAGLVVYVNVFPSREVELWSCPLRSLTGFLCPGCGATHCVVSIFRFEFFAALTAHPVVFAAFFPAAAAYLYNLYTYMTRGVFVGIPNSPLYVVLAALIVFTLLRNIL